MPVLARIFEAAGLSTVFVTNMPFWAEKVGVPRTLAVEHPFGCILGEPNQPTQQVRIIHQALQLLEIAEEPGFIQHSPEVWPVPVKEATGNWQPDEPSPIIRRMAPRIRQLLRESRTKATGS